MKPKALLWGVLAGVLVGAIGYWFQPYNQPTILGLHIWVVMGVGAFLAAALLLFFLEEKPGNKAGLIALGIAFFVALGVVAAVLARIIYDTLFRDSTSHNLAPFELLICFVVTIPGAFAGALLALFANQHRK